MPRLADSTSLEDLRERIGRATEKLSHTITLCAGPGCQACSCLPVAQALAVELLMHHLTKEVRLRLTGCHGFCEQGTLVIIDPGAVCYVRVTPEDIPEIVERTIMRGEVVERLLYRDPDSGEPIRTEREIPFYAAQDRLLLQENRFISPHRIQDYLERGGYSALVKALTTMTPAEVLAEVGAAGLRGRGGGGYPAARKWEQCRDAEGAERFVICNADEGDPGAYMDRGLLEGNPQSVLEGMLLGAYAIGARQGFVYVRKEYPLAVLHITAAINQARILGLLGEDILGTGFSFDVRVARGGGAFVCGESTALMASLEGKVGEPRPKDIHTVEQGYLDLPTVLNNVETWANVPLIIREGAAWYAEKGVGESKGTKIFALTGQVKNSGLVEVEMGTSLKEIIFGIGGGPKNGRSIKAVQTGGPSGGCLPVSQFDLPVDFDELYEAGSMMGSGGMVVLDDTSCMVDVAKYFLKFLQDESCGKCVPCRIGVSRILEIVTDFTEGRGSVEQLELLHDLCDTVSLGSLCALGKTAPNPVLSTLKNFEDEYMEHIENGRCPAGVCRALIRFTVDNTLCDRCGKCILDCPHKAITGDEETDYVIDDDVCNRCGICAEVCEPKAIIKT